MAQKADTFDVVIVGGGIYGASVAWWLTRDPGFDGRIAVIERDPSYSAAATSLTNSCIRQQFSAPINIRISQFGAEFIRNFRDFMGGAPDVPALALQSFGYLCLADTPDFLDALRESQKIQHSLGAGTQFMAPAEIAKAYPFFNLDGILGANHNRVDEGYFDGGTMFDWFRRMARRNGAEFVTNEVVRLSCASGRVEAVHLQSGETLKCGVVVNAAGTRGPQVARMAGLRLPVEPRKRYTYVFDAADPLDQTLPLSIDPSGVHVRSDGRYYMAGCAPDDDVAVDVDDFQADHSLWEDKVWPVVAMRIPQFERIKLMQSWVGHYDYNTFDQNAILGPHPDVPNFLFANGFSGHGLQQSPALGRGLAEWIAYGAYRSLDLSPLGVERVLRGEAFVEKAVI